MHKQREPGDGAAIEERRLREGSHIPEANPEEVARARARFLRQIAALQPSAAGAGRRRSDTVPSDAA